jgi:hypothetical protein
VWAHGALFNSAKAPKLLGERKSKELGASERQAGRLGASTSPKKKKTGDGIDFMGHRPCTALPGL